MSTTFSANLGSFESLNVRRQVRLEAMLLPHALHRRVADTNLLGQHARAPVRGVLRLLFGRARDDPEPHLVADALLAGARPLALVLEQALDTAVHVGLLPPPDRRLGNARLAADRVGAKTSCGQQNDGGALDDLLRRLAIGNQPLQSRPITGPDVQACLNIPHVRPLH